MAVVFPDGLACLENIPAERDVPDQPLVNQTLHDCLTEAMDIAWLEQLLGSLERDEKHLVTRDLPHPSPLAQEILTARPYAFLDDALLEERLTQAVMGRRLIDPLGAADFGQLDREAIERVRAEACPQVDTPDE